MVLYLLDQNISKWISDRPYSVFFSIRFNPFSERYSALVYPTRNRYEHKLLVLRYKMYGKRPLSSQCIPLFHRLATMEHFSKYGMHQDISYKDDIIDQKEYLDAVMNEESRFLPIDVKRMIINIGLVDRQFPARVVSFIEEEVRNFHEQSD